MESNKLEVIVTESGLEPTKAGVILSKFKDYFDLAAEWERKSKTIVVTNENQLTDMQMARTARLFLREKRIAIENARKELKEQALREGKAIDGIANVLKALIVPIEEYLEKQEKFVELRKAEKEEIIRIEVEKKMEEERISKERAEAEERERIKSENDRLKKEAEAKELALQQERKKVEAEKLEAERQAKAEQDRLKKEAEEKLSQEKRIADAKIKEEQEKSRIEREKIEKENQEKLSKERAERDKIEAELKSKKEEEERIKREEIEKVETLKKADDNIKLLKLQEDLSDIQYPEVKSDKSKEIINQVKSLLNQANDVIQKGKQ